MVAIKLSEKCLKELPESCDNCIYYGCRPHPYKGWSNECELCCQCLDDDQDEGWIYDGNGRPKNCPMVEIPDELLKEREKNENSRKISL